MRDHARDTLVRKILEMSDSGDWNLAVKEWNLVCISSSDCAESCLCGHYPIIDLCHIRNRVTKISAIVGNVCVNNFLGIGTTGLFSSYKLISNYIDKSMSEDLIYFSHRRRLINDWEKNFCLSTFRKRNLSDKAIDKRISINQKVLSGMGRLIDKLKEEDKS
jgi:hypothetical protein